MNKILESERLILRELTDEDAEHFYQLNADEEVIRFTGDLPFGSINEVRDFLAAYDHYKLYGFGRWAVLLKENMEFIGWCGLKYDPESGEHDLGFRFFRPYWGRGFATEAAKACIEVAFGRFHIPVLYGRALKQNTASIRVLEKCGMTFSGTGDFHGEEGVVYSISR